MGGTGRSQATAVGCNASGAGLSNGVVQHGEAVGGGTSTNGGGAAASGGHGEKATDANGALFGLYRGLLQFLLQVTDCDDSYLCFVSACTRECN